jgi:hypothetical protein
LWIVLKAQSVDGAPVAMDGKGEMLMLTLEARTLIKTWGNALVRFGPPAATPALGCLMSHTPKSSNQNFTRFLLSTGASMCGAVTSSHRQLDAASNKTTNFPDLR